MLPKRRWTSCGLLAGAAALALCGCPDDGGGGGHNDGDAASDARDASDATSDVTPDTQDGFQGDVNVDSTVDTVPPDAPENDGVEPSVDCSDPEQNPFLGTCVEDVFSCFDAEGSCTSINDEQNGTTTVTWDNGAQVVVTIDPQTFVFTFDYIASNGTTCATGEAHLGAGGGCTGQGYVVLNPGEADEVLVCDNGDAGDTYTCPDGSSFTVSPDQDEAAGACLAPVGAIGDECTGE